MTPTTAVAPFRADDAPRGRRGVTLVELLVVMSIIAALGALALMLLPSIANSDMAIKGAGEVHSTLKISQGMAAAAKLPRGVRFIVGQSGTSTQLIATEMQYLESPPIMVAEPRVMVGTVANDYSRPHVEIRYDLNPDGSVANRHCIIYGLTPEQAFQVADGAILVLPVLNAWSRVNGAPTVVAANATTGKPQGLEVVLEVYPDAHLGGATWYNTFHFGVYGPPVPPLAEPTIPLPKDIGVDLSISYPVGQPGRNYDVMFAPSGQTITTTSVTGNTGVYLWVRDVVTRGDMTPLTMPPPTAPGASPGPWTFDMNKFRRGGEQQIVGIRNGFIGTAPVLWPNANGDYGNPATQDPYFFARQKLN